ncbi:hypothetical protein GA0074692_4597 [Micromonospora pallida]|uniref:Uncharacterized protein n=1 Tax=Micromonospora pallida TaxID=145854 RepID=A0A1C6T6E7_9ACTN|nr:hypothetical protein GA0074692_4597 [Micromonospora pallida]
MVKSHSVIINRLILTNVAGVTERNGEMTLLVGIRA